jgi:hypothetical protein
MFSERLHFVGGWLYAFDTKSKVCEQPLLTELLVAWAGSFVMCDGAQAV